MANTSVGTHKWGECVLRHPLRKVIDGMLSNGDSYTKIEEWLKASHYNKRMHLNRMTIFYYNNNYRLRKEESNEKQS